MNTKSRIQMGHPHGQTPPNTISDFEWIHHHEKELLEQYGECSIIVYQQKVIGVGTTYRAALENAEANLPADVQHITPVHEWLYQRQPFFNVYPQSPDIGFAGILDRSILHIDMPQQTGWLDTDA